jgi:subtilisin family serine protease
MRFTAFRTTAMAGSLAALAACSDTQPTQLGMPDAGQYAPVYLAQDGRGVEGQYIVVLNDEASPLRVAQEADAGPRFVYQAALRGFAAQLTEAQVRRLQRDERVRYIEQDRYVERTATQTGATWGLDRVDQRNLPLDGSYTYNADGTGVHAYIIDTGILLSHTQFTGRLGNGYDAVTSGGSANDCNGHGTHVAGTVGGTTYGIAKKVTLHPVRVLDCAGSGTNAGVVAGMDWVTANRVKPAVANMSLGGGASTAVDDATNRMIAAGVVTAVAAGNDNVNACNSSPARVAGAITVGSTTSTDARSSFSNYGSCLDVFAPGSSITSAWHTGSSATNTISGTSMASPHVAGVAVLYMQGNPTATNQQARDAIVNAATCNKVTSAGTGSPNKLLSSSLSATGNNCTTTPPPSGGTFNYSGSLSGTGANAYQPGTAGYTSTVSGTHKATMTGTGADFDLYLQKLSGSTWSNVASSLGTTSSESITYSGTAGTYRWRVYSYSGSGTYTLSTTRP